MTPELDRLTCDQDNLAMSAIQFLTTVSRSVKANLFQNPETMQQVSCLHPPSTDEAHGTRLS